MLEQIQLHKGEIYKIVILAMFYKRKSGKTEIPTMQFLYQKDFKNLENTECKRQS